MLLARSLHALVLDLLSTGDLLLVEGATPETLAQELVAALPSQAAFAQVGPYLAQALIQSPWVEELFTDDHELAVRLSGLEL